MRLIDAELLKKHLDIPDCMMPQRSVIEAIDREPTIDPVKHGHWYDYDSDDGWYCSVCGHPARYISGPNYCPYCGAKMDEVTE